MGETRTLKANLKLQGQPCGWCQQPLALGNDATLCGSCEAVHHASCWQEKGGCSRAGCTDAPLKRLDPAIAQPLGGTPAAVDPTRCPRCGGYVLPGAGVCDTCQFIMSPDGLYHGPRENAPGAVASLVCGIIGFFVAGMILGIIAIVQSTKARNTIRSSPRYTGGGMATAGMVLGIIDIVAWIYIMSRM